MKKILHYYFGLIIFLICIVMGGNSKAQTVTDRDWAKIDKMVKEHSMNDAFTQTELLLDRAIEHQQPKEILTAVWMKSKISSEYQENYEDSIGEWMKGVKSYMDEPHLAIWHILMASYYKQYSQRVRDGVGEDTSEPFIMWSKELREREVMAHIDSALQSVDLLKTIDSKDYSRIFINKRYGFLKREGLLRTPTLMDVVLRDAFNISLGYNEREEVMEMEDYSKWVAPIQEFGKVDMSKVEGALSPLRYLQQWERFYENGEVEMQIALYEMRLDYLKRYAAFRVEMESELIKAIDYYLPKKDESITKLYYILANGYEEKGKLGKAVELCDKAYEIDKSNEGTKQCMELKGNIVAQRIELECEKEGMPNHSRLVKMTTRNVKKVWFRLYDISRIGIDKKLEKCNRLASWEMEINDKGDYEEVVSAVVMPIVGSGDFVLCASYDEDFGEKNIVCVEVINSRIAIEQYDFKQDDEFWSGFGGVVRNREDGIPIAGVKLRIIDDKKVIDETVSDRNGYFQFAKDVRHSWSSDIEVEDSGFVWQMDIHSKYIREYKSEGNELKIWLDRPVYKLGEEVKWAVVLNHEDSMQNSSVIEGAELKVVLRDVNDKEVDSMMIVTDSYGRGSGKFRLNESGLNGDYSIVVESEEWGIDEGKDVTVIAYKQPKFVVRLVEDNMTYVLGRETMMRGMATAYSGASMSGAMVKYKVASGYYDYRKGEWVDNVLASGKTVCDREGKFEFVFTPIEDNRGEEEYEYNVEVSVTDVNGETQTVSRKITASKNPRKLLIQTDENQCDWKWLRFAYQNLDGDALWGDVKVVVEQLKQIERPLLRLKYWSDDMQQSIDSMTFEENFSQYAYDLEAMDPMNWVVENVVVDTVCKVASVMGEMKMPIVGTGVYRITLKDEFGTEAKRVVRVTNEKARKCMSEEVVWCDMEGISYEVGESARLRIGSRYRGVNVMYHIVKGGEIVKRGMMELNDEIKMVEIPIKKNLLGGFSVVVSSIYQNKEWNGSYFVAVPYSEKVNKIELVTFRDKMQPGSKEQWTLKTSKPNSALLLTMYDEALSSYRTMNWNRSYWRLDYARYESRYLSSDSRNDIDERWFNNQHFKWDELGQVYYSFCDSWIDILEGNRVRYCYGAPMVKNSARVEEDCMEMASPSIMMEKSESVEEVENEGEGQKDVTMRMNLNPSAFFMADLVSDDEGMVSISFEAPDLLTMWTIQGFGWTKDMSVGHMMQRVVTQKDLMVMPNVPRFMRQGDKMSFGSKVTNLSKMDERVEVEFWLMNTENEKVVAHDRKHIAVKANESEPIEFEIEIPDNMYVATYKIVARGKNCSDGEQGQIPVLSNRQLVTESMSMYINGNEKKEYDFEHLRDNKSKSLQHYGMMLEFTSNPMWYALQALPYMKEHKSPSTIYLINQLYVSELGMYIVDQNPMIEEAFSQWSEEDLKSNLERNESIKQTALTETPWLNQAKSEAEQHRMVAQYFDSMVISQLVEDVEKQLLEGQREDGGWSWINGDRSSSVYVTEYILRQMGSLKGKGVEIDDWKDELKRALKYCDKMEYEYYLRLMESKYRPEVSNIYYLYMRSYYPDSKITKEYKKGYNYFYLNALKRYKEYSDLYTQAQLALIFYRNGDKKEALDIAKSVKGRALYSDEMGMYWRDNISGYWWYERPVETQTMLIKMFDEVLNDKESVGKMQQWLLKQKQTTNWGNDVATANAIEALLCGSGAEQLKVSKPVEIKVGEKLLDVETQKGTGYITKMWSGDEVDKKLAKVSLKKITDGCGWGAMYWQYFEDLDKIKYSKMGIKMDKRYYKVGADDKVQEIADDAKLRVGDKVRVRILIDCDRHLEYLQLKDMRAAAFEPTSSESGWRWNWSDGLSYYVDVQNVCVNFYINRLDKGKYILEYDMWVTNSGEFSCGIATMQCMYAPEFRCNTQGVRMLVE